MSSPARELLQSIRNRIRGAELRGAEEFHFIARLIVWTKLGQPTPQDTGLLTDASAMGSTDLRRCWTALAAESSPAAVRSIFVGSESSPYTRLSQDMVSNAIDAALPILLLTDSAKSELSTLLQQWATEIRHTGQFTLSPKIAEFIVALLRAPEGSDVLIPGNYSEMPAIEARRSRLIPEVVSPDPPFLAGVDTVLTGGDLKYQDKDPFTGMFHASATSVHWDSAIVLPPLGLRQKSLLDDKLAVMTGEARATDIALDKVLGNSVVLVGLSFLFARGRTEAAYRERLVRSGRLKAVVVFPGGLLQGTGIAFALLQLGPESTLNTITFCRVENEDISTPGGKLRASSREFTGAARILRLLDEPDETSCIRVRAADIASNDFDLSPARYFPQQASFFTARAAELQPLGSLFKVIKPQHLVDARGKEAIAVREVSLGEIPENGRVERAARSRDVDAAVWKSRADQALAADDVLLSVKGTIGRVAVVGSLAPNQQPMVPSSSLVVLRAQGNAKSIDPCFFALYLRSPVVQSQLQSLSIGTIPNIPLQTLRALLIWVPPIEAQRQWARAFEHQAELQQQIDDIQREQSEITAKLWRATGLEE